MGTDLKDNDESQACCQDVPELQCVTVGHRGVRRVSVVPVPERQAQHGR